MCKGEGVIAGFYGDFRNVIIYTCTSYGVFDYKFILT